MSYNWLNLYEIPEIQNDRVILFGAGAGSEDLLNYINFNDIKTDIVCITDNDTSLHGKLFKDYSIIAPEDIKGIDFDKILVTSVSGRDAISKQLIDHGYVEDKQFYLVGKFPSSPVQIFEKYFNSDERIELLADTICLNVGPGGLLGFEVLLYCFGAKKIISIDKNSFGISYPDVTSIYNDYVYIEKYLENYQDVLKRDILLKRFSSLFLKHDGKIKIDENKILFQLSTDLCETNLRTRKFDFVFTSGVLEHVENPKKAVMEIYRILKYGGISVNNIITQDHRSFSCVSGYDPVSFRVYTHKEWDALSKKKFFQNRMLPVEWRNLFNSTFMQDCNYFVDDYFEVDNEKYLAFDDSFKGFSLQELSELNCFLVSEKLNNNLC